MLLAASVACMRTGVADEGSGHAPYLAVQFARTPVADVANSAGNAGIEALEYRLLGGLNLARTGRYSFEAGLDYQYTRYEYRNVDSRNRDQHRLQFPLRMRGTTGDWAIDACVAPGISTSSNVFKRPFERWSGDDMFVSAALEGGYPQGRRWRWVFGATHDRAFGRSSTYPIAGVTYEDGDRLSVRLAFPDTRVAFAVNDRHELTVRAHPAGHQWRVYSDSLDRDFNYRVRGWRGDLTWSYRFWRPVRLDVTLGSESRRRHRFTDDLGMRLTVEPDDQWFFGVGLRFGDAPLPIAHAIRH